MKTQFFFWSLVVCLLDAGSLYALDYTIKGTETLRISVYNNTELNSVVRVTEKGIVSLPLIGEMSIAGLTVNEIEHKISKVLRSKAIVTEPQVNVFVENYKARWVTIIGEVVKPGQYEIPINEPMHLLDIISKASGLTKNAGDVFTIVRDNREGIIIDASKMFAIHKTEDLATFNSTNIQLIEKDIIYVPRAPFFYVYGEVKNPGYYKIDEGLSISKAISIAGGYTGFAATDKVRITRTLAGKERIILLAETKEKAPGFNLEKFHSFKVIDNDVLFIPRATSFYIYGEVHKPGTYKIDTEVSVVQAISIAGGFTSEATSTGIKIIRSKEKRQAEITLNLKDSGYTDESITKQTLDLSQNINIENGDTLFIPRRASFFVFGSVKNPGMYQIEEGLTLIKALSISGGINNMGTSRNIKVTRKKNTFPIKMNARIEGGDVIIVPESLF